MSDEPHAGLGLIARQQGQLLAEVGTIRDDLTVLTAIVQRLDGTLAGLVNENTSHAHADEPDGPARAGIGGEAVLSQRDQPEQSGVMPIQDRN